MRVLTLTWEYPPHIVGGLGRHVAELAPALAAQGVEMTVLTPRFDGGAAESIEAPGLRVVRVNMPPALRSVQPDTVEQGNQFLLQQARKLIGPSREFDLIHAHDWLTADVSLALKHSWQLPLVVTIHATERGRHAGWLQGSQSRQIDYLEWQLTYESWRVIVCSEFMREHLRVDFATPGDKISIVPNGIKPPIDPFASEAARLAFRRQYAADTQPLALYVGRLVYEKGVQVLLRAWSRIRERLDARLVIAGSGGYFEELQTLAVDLGIADMTMFAGFISDEEREQLYRVADVAVFPSLYEPFGIVALEAFAANCPVVATRAGGLGEVIKPHETGILVDPDTIEGLTWGILHTLQYPDWGRARAANALREVHSRFTWPRIAEDTLAIYERVLAEQRVSGWGARLAPAYDE
jgi:glycosyltransferase involved in cell wall biosynthesis